MSLTPHQGELCTDSLKSGESCYHSGSETRRIFSTPPPPHVPSMGLLTWPSTLSSTTSTLPSSSTSLIPSSSSQAQIPTSTTTTAITTSTALRTSTAAADTGTHTATTVVAIASTTTLPTTVVGPTVTLSVSTSYTPAVISGAADDGYTARARLTGTVIGAATATSIVFLLVIVGTLFFLHRRRRRDSELRGVPSRFFRFGPQYGDEDLPPYSPPEGTKKQDKTGLVPLPQYGYTAPEPQLEDDAEVVLEGDGRSTGDSDDLQAVPLPRSEN
ncbi:hypothetical protein C8Q74DRAFT_981789 [Fomes fomentarius]|nr:hypothetical protein C8Q74DRAFT_981789 [Fomes fomentarius]